MSKRWPKQTKDKRTPRKVAKKIRQELGDDPAAWNAYLSSIGLGTTITNSAKNPHGKQCRCKGCKARRKSKSLR